MLTPRDVLSPLISGDQRISAGEPVFRRVFADQFYEVFVALYPGGLLGCLIHYKRDNLRIMTRLGETPPLSSGMDEWVKAAVAQMSENGRGPYHWIMNAKLETQSTLTLHDRAAMKLAGVEVPRSAGRYKDLFLKDR